MNEYLIEHKIKTLAELWDDDFAYEGYDFRQWDFTIADGALGDAWIAKKVIEAEDVLKAINTFREKLNSVIERVSFTSQCFATINPESYLIIKKNNNPEHILFLFSSKERKAVPLHFGVAEKEALSKIDNFKRQAVFRYLNESTNASTYYTRLAMLVISLESIASAMKKEAGLNVKEYIEKDILNDSDLYNKLFADGTGIRNRLFHGQEVSITEDYVERIYKKIVGYFNTKYGLKINAGVVNPQRNFTNNHEAGRAWLKLKDETSEIDLKKAVEVFEMAYGGYDRRDRGEFDKIFLFAKKPNDY